MFFFYLVCLLCYYPSTVALTVWAGGANCALSVSIKLLHLGVRHLSAPVSLATSLLRFNALSLLRFNTLSPAFYRSLYCFVSLLLYCPPTLSLYCFLTVSLPNSLLLYCFLTLLCVRTLSLLLSYSLTLLSVS